MAQPSSPSSILYIIREIFTIVFFKIHNYRGRFSFRPGPPPKGRAAPVRSSQAAARSCGQEILPISHPEGRKPLENPVAMGYNIREQVRYS
jgi:hypothetical protein